MNKATKTTIKMQLAECQARARVRTMGVYEALAEAAAIEKFLRTAPVGTSVKTNWSRVANCYRGVPEGTFVRGERGENGIALSVMRGKGAFGSRLYSVSVPAGYKISGPSAHSSSGATDVLRETTIVAKQ